MLRPGLAEKEGLRAGELAHVCFGPDYAGDMKVSRDGEELCWFQTVRHLLLLPSLGPWELWDTVRDIL